MSIRTYDDYTDLHPRDLTAAANILGPSVTPFINVIGGFSGGIKVTNTEIEFKNWALGSMPTALNGAIIAGAGAMTLDDATWALENTQALIVDPANGDEIVLCTSSPGGSNPVSITRGQGGTADVNHGDNSVVIFFGIPALEGAAWADTTRRTETSVKNYTQIFEANVRVSGSEAAVEHVGLPGGETSLINFYGATQLKELMIQAERCGFHGRKHAATPQGSGSVRRTFGGLDQLITFAPTGSDAANAALSKTTHLDPVMIALAEQGATPNMIISGPKQMCAFENLLLPYKTGGDQAQTTFNGSIVQWISTVLGPMALLQSPHCSPSRVYIVDTRLIEFCALGNRTLRYIPAGNAGDYDGGMITGEYTLRVFGGASQHAVIKNLA